MKKALITQRGSHALSVRSGEAETGGVEKVFNSVEPSEICVTTSGLAKKVGRSMAESAAKRRKNAAPRLTAHRRDMGQLLLVPVSPHLYCILADTDNRRSRSAAVREERCPMDDWKH